MFSKKEEVKSIGNPAGIGKGTGFGLRERDRDGIGLGHYRLRATTIESKTWTWVASHQPCIKCINTVVKSAFYLWPHIKKTNSALLNHENYQEIVELQVAQQTKIERQE